MLIAVVRAISYKQMPDAAVIIGMISIMTGVVIINVCFRKQIVIESKKTLKSRLKNIATLSLSVKMIYAC